MTALDRAKNEALELLRTALPSDVSLFPSLFERPPRPEMGDLAFPCFPLAKALKKAPPAIAGEIAAAIVPSGLIASAEAVGPYVNFRFDRAAFASAVLTDVAAAGDRYGEKKDGGRSVMVEYGSPNTHKEIHVGHLRNFTLGLSVVKLLRAQGHKVVPVSYIGDIGAHVAKCLWALKTFHDGEQMPENRGKFLGSVYAEGTAKVDEDPSRKEAVAEVQRKLEAREPEWDALWKETRQWSIDELSAIFGELGIAFDRTYYESEVEEPGKKLVAELLERGIAEKGEGGALIVDLAAEDLGVFLALKSDGSSLYSTKELALAELKRKEYPGMAESVHIVDTRQSLYFRQFFATLKRMGFDQEMVHLGYEFVTLKEGAMSSRKGNIITYEDFRDTMMDRVRKETRERHEDWDDTRVGTTAWAIAESAMKFGMLKQDNDKPIVFDMDAALSFDGFTGPYVQYAHARLSSILAKAGVSREVPAGIEGSDDADECRLLRAVADLPDTIAAAAAAHRPSLLAQYVFDLAQATSDFYRDVPVLKAEGDDRTRRLAVAASARAALAHGLALLGIKAPDEM